MKHWQIDCLKLFALVCRASSVHTAHVSLHHSSAQQSKLVCHTPQWTCKDKHYQLQANIINKWPKRRFWDQYHAWDKTITLQKNVMARHSMSLQLAVLLLCRIGSEGSSLLSCLAHVAPFEQFERKRNIRKHQAGLPNMMKSYGTFQEKCRSNNCMYTVLHITYVIYMYDIFSEFRPLPLVSVQCMANASVAAVGGLERMQDLNAWHIYLYRYFHINAICLCIWCIYIIILYYIYIWHIYKLWCESHNSCLNLSWALGLTRRAMILEQDGSVWERILRTTRWVLSAS